MLAHALATAHLHGGDFYFIAALAFCGAVSLAWQIRARKEVR